MSSSKTAPSGADPAQRSARYKVVANSAAARANLEPSNGQRGTAACALATSGELRGLQIASEAIAVIDIVQSTLATNLYGWHAVGRVVTRDLRRLAREACAPFGLTSMETRGDGLLMTFSDGNSAALAVPAALAAMRSLLAKLGARNREVPAQQRLDVRVALHFGEVDIIEDSREGPNVAFACRLETVSSASLSSALNAIDPHAFPSANYVICSEAVANVLDHVGEASPRTSCGLFRMKGFLGWWEVFLVEPAPGVRVVPRSQVGA